MDNNNNDKFNPIDNNQNPPSDNGKGYTGWAIIAILIVLAFFGFIGWGIVKILGLIF